MDDETRRMNFIIDVYKFYFKERMFMLKTLNTILTTKKENILYVSNGHFIINVSIIVFS